MAANFKIVSQAPLAVVNAEGRVVPGVQITFKTIPSGAVGRVSIASDSYTVEEAARVIGDAAATMEAVQAL